MILAVVLSVGSVLTAANAIYSTRPEHKERPIKGYLQVVKILLYVAACVVIVATLMDRSPWLFLSGIGAMTAVLLLIFKDTILSLVASIQLTSNEMVRVGDWIEMPQLGADGDVIDVALHTVKVQNWDKTITTIPTHKLISESFKNWRGMSDSGGRRIKRSLFLDLNTIRFLEAEEIERFGRFALLKDYIGEKREELAEFNQQPGRDLSLRADTRQLTNVGTLRAYIVNYLRAHPSIRQDMTLIVRQRDPGPNGLPLEIYTFTNDTRWAAYEDIQSDIFDHILAIVPEFGLRVFQTPSGHDFAQLGT
jgi:miniconductance mechanosensitive channel